MRRSDRKASITNRIAGTTPATAAPLQAPRFFEIKNFAEEGYAEIKIRGYIGAPKMERDWITGELVASGGAGTLQEFENELEALGDVKKLQLSIFSEGGDVFTGMAMHNLLVRHPAKKLAIIDGICASAATYIALACREIEMPANAWMMIHASENCVSGNAVELREAADMLDSVDAAIVNLYASRTGKSENEIRQMMAEETWMNGQQAVENGFADSVIEPLTNLAARTASLQPTNAAILRHAPAEVLALFDMTRISNAARTRLPALDSILPSSNMQTTTPAPTNAAPSPTAPAVSAAPAVETPAAAPAPTNAATAPAAAPTNAAPDIAAIVKEAVTNAVAPLQAEIERLKSLDAHGVSPKNLGGAQPVAGMHADPTNAADKKMDVTEWRKLSPLNRAKFFREGGELTDGDAANILAR